MSEEIKEDAMRRSIQRLCHFTPSVNLLHVLKSGYLKDRATLDKEQNPVVNPTDDLRLDGHRETICCSIEYPNTYYLDVVSKREKIFDGWVILLLAPELLWTPKTLFCEKNAAFDNGRLIKAGLNGYQSMYPQEARGFSRKLTHLPCCPTDMQAEVLIPGPIHISKVIGMAMHSVEQVKTEIVRWEVLGISRPKIPLFVAPNLFSKIDLRNDIWLGRRPAESVYEQ